MINLIHEVNLMADLSLIKFWFSRNLSSISLDGTKKKVIERGEINREYISKELWCLVTNEP
jgi:hypothetical protein